MLDHFLANPKLVALAGAVVAIFALAWRHYDSQNDRIARLQRKRSRRNRDD
ncbi:MAG: hypothetical protein K0Q72_3669 [Armatimonadetes bacterium]|jgi:hypothetical protein|nr:hypothetical protein [Armatimonadota bacterium]